MIETQATVNLLVSRFMLFVRSGKAILKEEMFHCKDPPWTDIQAERAFYQYEIFTILYRNSRGRHCLTRAKALASEEGGPFTQSESGELRIVAEYTMGYVWYRLKRKMKEHLKEAPTSMY